MSAPTSQYFAAFRTHLQRYSVTPRNDIFHDIQLLHGLTSSMTISYSANWHLPWYSVISRTDFFHDIQLLHEMTSSVTFSYFVNLLLPWHSVTSRIDNVPLHSVTPRNDMFHDIQLLREPTELQKHRTKLSVQPSFKGAFVTHAQYARWCFWETMTYETQVLGRRKELCNWRNFLEKPLEVEKTVGVTLQNNHKHTIPQIYHTTLYQTTNTSNCSVFYCSTNWFSHSYETHHKGNLIQNFLQVPRVFLGKKRKSFVLSRTGHLNHNYDIIWYIC